MKIKFILELYKVWFNKYEKIQRDARDPVKFSDQISRPSLGRNERYNNIEYVCDSALGKAKCTRETKMMSNLSLDLHIDWLPLSLQTLYNLHKKAKPMQAQPGSMVWEPTD